MDKIAQAENLLSIVAIVAGSWQLWGWPVAAIIGGILVIALNLINRSLQSSGPDA